MTKLAKDIDLLEKKLSLIKENYLLVRSIIEDFVPDFSLVDLSERYKLKLRELQLKRKRETTQIDLEDIIKDLKNENNNSININ